MIYAINKRTKEHVDVTDMHMPRVAQYANGDEWHLVGADDDGWIKWNGGECPLPDGVPHEVQIRDSRPQTWRWDNSDSDGDIIAYRPLDADEPAEPEAVEWDGEGLPPVGCECNCWHTGSHQGAVTVRYIGSEMCVLLNHDRGEEQCGPIDAYRFEPLRTAAQRAEDEAVEEMHPIIAEWLSDGPVEIARTLYRAGYRKR